LKSYTPKVIKFTSNKDDKCHENQKSTKTISLLYVDL